MNRSVGILIILGLLACAVSAQDLSSYVDIALENNPGLQAIHKDYEAELSKVRQVRALPDPTLSFGYFVSPVETRVGPQRARISVSQMLPWFGTLEHQGNAARLAAESKYALYLDKRNEIRYRLATKYYPLIELQSLIDVEEEYTKLLQSIRKITVNRFENGLSNMSSVLRIDLFINESETITGILRKQSGSLETAFNSLLNRKPETEIILPDLTEYVSISVVRLDSNLNNNLKLQALQLQEQALAERELSISSQAKPRIGFGLDYVIVGERQDMAVADNGKDVLMPMISLSLPIFSGRYKAMSNEARLRQQQYSLQREELHNDLQSKISDSEFRRDRSLDLLELYRSQIAETQRILSLTVGRYSNGEGDFEAILQLSRQLLEYKKKQVVTWKDLMVTTEELNYLLNNTSRDENK